MRSFRQGTKNSPAWFPRSYDYADAKFKRTSWEERLKGMEDELEVAMCNLSKRTPRCFARYERVYEEQLEKVNQIRERHQLEPLPNQLEPKGQIK